MRQWYYDGKRFSAEYDDAVMYATADEAGKALISCTVCLGDPEENIIAISPDASGKWLVILVTTI